MPQDLPVAKRPDGGVSRQFPTSRAVVALILREMATRYGRSPGGYIWALLEPMGAIGVMAFGFSLLINNPPLGNSFILFFATGFLVFGVYQDLSLAVSRSIQFSRPLLFYPTVTWVDAVVARLVLNTLTSILVILLLMTTLVLVTDARIVLDMSAVVEAVGLAILFGTSVGMVNCVLLGLFPIWGQIWSIATRPLFIISGVFFLYEGLPTLAQNILWYNPLMHITGLMRKGFYSTYSADYVSIPFVAGVSVALLFLGVVTMGRFHRDILNDG